MISLNDWKFDDGKWYQAGRHCEDCEIEWFRIDITVVPISELLRTYERLVIDLADKEVKLVLLKEFIGNESFRIEQHTDFKELYNKNNAEIRKHHIRSELADVYDELRDLELSVNWIKSYIPLLKEAIRVKG